ncbi:hypothetical protein BKA91DRAFT_130858 [Yarrowia lipolytica]|nr:hypothetical protein BKA91DRAFT_130858 [Yarrowia lipolytica]KAE8169525.1 hypothetical protein BKA90DRAFT_131509 [Yarrowia lipolytica]RMI93979.1 hypothetical protein BD777DRAFT_138728 [Yarrowia lipolytica]
MAFCLYEKLYGRTVDEIVLLVLVTHCIIVPRSTGSLTGAVAAILSKIRIHAQSSKGRQRSPPFTSSYALDIIIDTAIKETLSEFRNDPRISQPYLYEGLRTMLRAYQDEEK